MFEKLIEAIQAGVKPERVSHEGSHFYSRNLYTPPSLPQPDAIITHTLDSLVDVLAIENGSIANRAHLIHVVSPLEVRVLGDIYGHAEQRDTFIKAVYDPMGVTRDRYMGSEDFAIQLLSRFTADGDRDYVLGLLGTISNQNSVTTNENGSTQKVTVKKGIQLTNETPKAHVKLHPMWTFPEVPQPQVTYNLRFHGGGNDDEIEIGLFDADGGRWKLDAIKSIRDYLKSKKIDIPIVA